MNVFQPEMVVFEVAEYTIINKYFDEEQMRKLEFNKGLAHYDSIISETTCPIETNGIDKCGIIDGDCFDSVFIAAKRIPTKEAYLITNGIVFDLQSREDGILETAVPLGILNNNDIKLCIIDSSGKYHVEPITLVRSKSIEPTSIDLTSGVLSDNDELLFETNLEDNRFNGLAIDLYDASDNSYLELVEFNNLLGSHYGLFFNSYHDGLFDVHIRANSNLHDESVCLYYPLVENTLYYYTYSIEQLEQDKIKIRDFSLIEFSKEYQSTL